MGSVPVATSGVIPFALLPLPRRVWLLVLIFLLWIGATASLVYDLGGWRDYLDGLHNRNQPFLPLRGLLFWLLSLVASLAVTIVLFVKPTTVWSRCVGVMLFVLQVVSIAGVLTFRVMPDDAYTQGFKQWVQTQISCDAIRSWLVAQPVATVDTPAPTPWPAMISKLSPGSVTILKGNRGVILEWGVYGTWGNARRVVIKLDPKDPWEDPNSFPSDSLGEGVYGGKQFQG